MKRKYIFYMYWILLVGCLGCSSSKKMENDIYLRCNDTSNNDMAETELGYYYVFDKIIYYADKVDLSNWVAVCNKPDCMHEDSNCNAYINSGITQRDGKIYGIDREATGNPYVFEIALDGSGIKKVYDIPFGEEIEVTAYRAMLSQEQSIIYNGYLAEDGMYHDNLSCLEEDGSLKTIYTEISDRSYSIHAHVPATSVGVRGDKAILSTLLTKTNGNFLNILWRMNGNEPERVNLPEDIDITWGYLTEDTFIYFKQKEGFYKYNFATEKKELIMKNQLEDSMGAVITEKYLIEMNRYAGYTPEEAYLKFYDGTEWLNVELPEEVKNSEKLFTIESIASDRIFMSQLIQESDNYRSDIYYFMLDDDTPKLIYCDQVTRYGEKTPEENSTENIIVDNEINFEPVTVFDNDDLLFQITGARIDEEQGYCLTTYWENRSNKAYIITPFTASINGLQCNTGNGIKIEAYKTYEECTSTEFSFGFNYNYSDWTDSDWFEIEKVYSINEYTDIELHLTLLEQKNLKVVNEEEIVHIYPYGEENAITYVREPESTDVVLVDNEYVTIIVRGYEDGILPNGNIKLYYFNKTDQKIMINMEDVTLNGYNLKSDQSDLFLYYLWMDGHCSALHTFSLDYTSESISEYKITDVEEIKFHLRVYPASYFGGQIGDDFVNNIFMIIP